MVSDSTLLVTPRHIIKYLSYVQAKRGCPANRPVIEMTIPSTLDETISPKGKHVVQLFVQYAPYDVDPKV